MMRKVTENVGQTYKGIDILKFIMAVFIVILHTHPFCNINDKLNFITADVLGRTAVPFFFAATGFLIETKINDQNGNVAEIIKKYICKILKLYLIWSVIYLPIIVYTKIINSDNGIKFGIITVIRDSVFSGSYAHLWYLPATAAGVSIVFFLKKRMGEWKTGICLAVLFVLGLLAQSYFGILSWLINENGAIWNLLKLVKKIMITSRNGIFFGSLFIYIGVLVADHTIRIKSWKIWTGFLLSVLLLSCESVWLHKMDFVREEDMYLMQIPAVFLLLQGSLQIKVKGNTDFLRSMSTDIYFIHLIFKFVYRQFIGEYNENGLMLFVFVLICTLISAYFLEKIKSAGHGTAGKGE